MNCDIKGDDFSKLVSTQAINEPGCLIMDLTNQFFSNGTSVGLDCPYSIPEDYVIKEWSPSQSLKSCFPYCDVCYTGSCA